MNFQRFALVLALAIVGLSYVQASGTVDVRLTHNSINKIDNALYVDIDVRVENQDRLNLAGQNYRIYYPTSILSLNETDSKSQLSPEKYSKLQFSSILENVEARGQGAIIFDDDLGFANFSVELLDNENGGARLTSQDGWVTIATLKFDILEEIKDVSMVWGRVGMSETYATAFVEIAAWDAPLHTSPVIIDEYIDFNLSISSLSLEGTTYDITIGPNPSSDFLEIRANKDLRSNTNVSIRDLSGKLAKKEQLTKGSSLYSIDVSMLQSASYILDIADQSGKSLFTQKIVVAQ